MKEGIGLCPYKSLMALAAAGLLLSSESSLAAAVWSTPPLTLSPANDPNPNDAQQVAINAKGQIVAAWNGLGGIQARIRTGGKWGASVNLEPVINSTSTLIHLAEAPDNTAIAIIKSATGVFEASFYNPATATWSPATAIPASTGTTVSIAKARFDGKSPSTATLVWVETTATLGICSVKSSLGTAASGWAAPVTISSSNECFGYMDLAVNNRGEAAVALGSYLAGRHGGIDSYVTSRNTAGIWTGLNSLGLGPYQTQTKVAIANNGVAIASFSEANLGVQWSRRLPVDGSWTTPAVIDGAVPAVDTAIAMDGAGNAKVVYPSYYPILPPASLQVVSLKAGSNLWSVPMPLTDAVASDITSFNIAATPAGSFIASWVDEGTMPATAPIDATAALGVSTLPGGTTVWSNTVLDWYYSYTAPIANTLSIATSNGRAAAFWSAYDPTNIYQSVKLSTTTLK